jgi:hypothetical protein
MSNLLARFRNGDNSQGIRQSTALTTVYLLEMNRKFEGFMQDKVEELEGRVAAQQARLSAKPETADVDWDDTLIEEEVNPVDELEWRRDVVPIVDVISEPAPPLAGTETTISTNRDAPIIEGPTLEHEPETEPEEPAEIPDYMTLLVGDQTDVEAEVEEPAVQPVEQIEPADDAPVRSIDESESALATDEEAVDEESPQDDEDKIADASPTNGLAAASDEDHQPADEGISALELLAETVDDTVPWFDGEQADEIALGDDIDPEPPEPDQVAVDNTVTATVEIPTRTISEDDDGNDDWDAALPAEGQKGQWV